MPGSTTQMYPNQNFGKFFPNLWNNVREELNMQEKTNLFYLKIGIFALFLAICTKYYLLDILEKVFGQRRSYNALDFIIFMITYKSSSTDDYINFMRNYLKFDSNLYSINYFSNYFSSITREEIEKFHSLWLTECQKNNKLSGWLYFDGSNVDNQSKNIELSEPGYNKSLTNKNIIAFSYLVSETGLPLYFDLYRGGLVDSKAIHRTINFLTAHGINIKGVVLDRGYCTTECVNYLAENKIDFNIILKKNTEAYKNLSIQVGNEIKFNANNFVIGTKSFGTQVKTKLFAEQDVDFFVNFYFSIDKNYKEISSFLEKYNQEYERLSQAINNHEKNVSVSSDMTKYFKIIYTDDGRYIEYDINILQKKFDSSGFFAVASSTQDTLSETYNVLHQRDIIEKAFRALKSELDMDTLRVHSTERVYGKFFIAFLSSVLRYYIASYAKKNRFEYWTIN